MLYTPSDFDYSPYFEIVKYPYLGLEELSIYRKLPWDKEGIVCNGEDDCYLPPDYIHDEKNPDVTYKIPESITPYHAINLLKTRFKNQS